MSPESSTVLEQELKKQGLFSSRAHEKLSIYIRELERWNRRVNLTSLHGDELVRRLLIEPSRICQQLQMSGTLVDIGSGNGSPGIPVYLTLGLARVHLVEARTRRAAFLRHVGNLVDPEKIIVHKARLEDIDDGAERVDWVSMQAVHPSAVLLAALKRWSHTTTRVVWITNVDAPPSPAAQAIREGGEVRAWVFQLDQS